MSTIVVKQAAGRLRDLDKHDPQRNGSDLLITASGGYGKARQAQLLVDLRDLYAYALGEKPGSGSFGDDAA